MSWSVDSVIETVSDSNVDYGIGTLHMDVDESVPGGYYSLFCVL